MQRSLFEDANSERRVHDVSAAQAIRLPLHCAFYS